VGQHVELLEEKLPRGQSAAVFLRLSTSSCARIAQN
jgi:hypothetical protein